MISQEEYWDKQISLWTKAAYGKGKREIGLIERAASLFRGAITRRVRVALKEVGPRLKGKIVLDMGCGLGDFCFEILKYQPKKVIGIDVSGVAIEQAKKIARKKSLNSKLEFIHADIAGMRKLPCFDFAVGLGFIDYLTKQELRRLFKLLSGHFFFFSVFEKKISLRNLVHAFYIKWQGCPGAFKHSRKDMLEIMPKDLKPRFVVKDKMLFVTNL